MVRLCVAHHSDPSLAWDSSNHSIEGVPRETVSTIRLHDPYMTNAPILACSRAGWNCKDPERSYDTGKDSVEQLNRVQSASSDRISCVKLCRLNA